MVPDPARGPIKGTFGIMVLILETVKRCKDNRQSWKELGVVLVDKNERVITLLELYSKAPNDHPNALKQALKYQEALNIIAVDIKKETQTQSEKSQGLEQFWSKTLSLGREAALSNVNQARISRYQNELRDITLDVMEETGLRSAIIGVRTHDAAVETNMMIKKLVNQSSPKATTKALKPRARVVDNFVGREDILYLMHQTHFLNAGSERDRPVITILTGMGGAGKTQLASKFASQVEARFPDIPVFNLNASSETSLQTDLETLVRSQGPSYDDAMVWLVSGISNWLLIMDNADDPSLKLSQFIPRSRHGHIIITTRDATRRLLAPLSTHVVDALPMEESIQLLLVSSGYDENTANRLYATEIAEEVGRLPLALSHAAAYINILKCLDMYLEIYRDDRIELMGRIPDLMQEYPHSVARTIQMSLSRLSARTREMVQLFAYFDARSIARCVIEKAAERGFSSVARRTNEPLDPCTIECANALGEIFLVDGVWKRSHFDKMIEECLRYSLLQFATREGEKFYSMHPLVQTYVKATSTVARGHPPRRLVVRLLASSITLSDQRYKFFTFNRYLQPHIRLIELKDVTEAGDYYGFGGVLADLGDKLGITHYQRCFNVWKDIFGDGDENTLNVTVELASLYRERGRAEDALPLQEEVLQKRREILGPDHLDTLRAMANLANTYSDLGRAEDALPLLEEALDKWKKMLGPNHRSTVLAMYSLFLVYDALQMETVLKESGGATLTRLEQTYGIDHQWTVWVRRRMEKLY